MSQSLEINQKVSFFISKPLLIKNVEIEDFYHKSRGIDETFLQ